MMKGGMIAIIAGIVAAAVIAGVVAVTVAMPGQPPDVPPEGAGGKKITIELNENLGLKEKGPE